MEPKEQRRSGWSTTIAATMFTLLVLYVLSFGPACWLTVKWEYSRDWLLVTYRPLIRFVADCPESGTHYCMLGNQPRMKASTKSLANKLNFEFAGGSNLDPKKDKHMHSAIVTIVDADHYEMEGIGWENGAPAKEMCNGMKLVRKK